MPVGRMCSRRYPWSKASLKHGKNRGAGDAVMAREYFRFFLRVALLIVCSRIGAPQIEYITAFTGTWKLNLSQSKFDPGPPFKSFSLEFARDGVRHLDLIGPDGKRVTVSLPWSDG